MSEIRYPPNYVWTGRDFNQAWEDAVKFCMQNGMVIKPEEESKILTRDMCSKITLLGNGIKDILNKKMHPKFPTKEKHCKAYIKEYSREWVAEQKKLPTDKQFVYNYMDRLVNYLPIHRFVIPEWDYEYVDQIIKLKDNLRTGISRRHQVITWIPEVDFVSNSPPCLQRIWIRRFNDEECEVHFDWRSHDLYGAWQSNYIGLFDMLQREIFTPLGISPVKVVDNCNSLHIYQADWEASYKV